MINSIQEKKNYYSYKTITEKKYSKYLVTDKKVEISNHFQSL